ncbi:MAG: DUF3501 family protein [Alphaproteobacteria bacterium TMED93]|nr:MAG: DUF3501 family protein [Alphaproteobacteria bacterium TMED93]
MEQNQIKPEDIYERKEYLNKRPQLRKQIVSRKRKRRVDVGPYVTLYFENRDTIVHQINEMVFIENGGNEQIEEEILAYKSLIPNGKELIATVMVEIDSPIKRAEVLSKMGGFEQTFSFKIGNLSVEGKAELDVDRTTSDGKASSVQFVHFNFNNEEIEKFKDTNSKIELSINHEAYGHSTYLKAETQHELSLDFN